MGELIRDKILTPGGYFVVGVVTTGLGAFIANEANKLGEGLAGLGLCMAGAACLVGAALLRGAAR